MKSRWFAFLLVIVLAVENGTARFCVPTPGSDCWPSTQEIKQWQTSLSSQAQVWSPFDAGYAPAIVPMNFLKTGTPAYVVQAGTTQDLINTVQFAGSHGIRVVTKCSGHDYNDRSSLGTGTIQLLTGQLTATSWVTGANPQNPALRMEAGVNWGTAYHVAAAAQRVVVGGHDPTVCAFGCLLGACHGALSRQYGFGMDNVEQFDIVLYNGTVLSPARSSPLYSDLFYAVLGSGANSYGVLLSITITSHPAPPQIVMLQGMWPNSVLSRYLHNVTWWSSPDDWPATVGGWYLRANPTHFEGQFLYSGSSYQEAINIFHPLASARGALTSITNYSSIYAYSVANADTSNWARQFLVNIVPLAQQPTLDQLTAMISSDAMPSWIVNYVFGGQIPSSGSVATDAIPSDVRNGMLEIVISNSWKSPLQDLDNILPLLKYSPQLYDLSSASYSNEYTSSTLGDNEIPDWKTRFFGNYSSLLLTKQHYDPCNLYTVEFGVASDLPTATCS